MPKKPTKQLAHPTETTREDVSELKGRVSVLETEMKKVTAFMNFQLGQQSRKPDGTRNWPGSVKQWLVFGTAVAGMITAALSLAFPIVQTAAERLAK